MLKSVLLLGFLLTVSISYCQLPTAAILGVVEDHSGSVVPGAEVTVRNVETSQTRSSLTGPDGSYRFSALPVGTYERQVEHAGFQKSIRKGLSLSVTQEAVVNVSLEIGPIDQTISVTADSPLVNTTSGSLGGAVDGRNIALLPLNGRNYIELALLQTGVAEHKNHGNIAGLVGTWFSSQGAPVRSNNYLLDGAILQNLFGAVSGSVSGDTLGVEGIREYRVVTNSPAAEYGMTMGSQIVMVSKNGTNNFHGSLFEYLRNSALDARNFFDYKTATAPAACLCSNATILEVHSVDRFAAIEPSFILFMKESANASAAPLFLP